MTTWNLVLTLLYLSTVAATLTETKQFYTLYNTLEDQKAFMEKEVWEAKRENLQTFFFFLTHSLLSVVLPPPPHAHTHTILGWNPEQHT